MSNEWRSNGPNFFQTRMGQKFYEADVPRIANALERIADALERLAPAPIPYTITPEGRAALGKAKE